MVVLRCCFGEFFLPFLGAAILGIVICAFLQISPKGNRKMLLFTAIGYGIFEGFLFCLLTYEIGLYTIIHEVHYIKRKVTF